MVFFVSLFLYIMKSWFIEFYNRQFIKTLCYWSKNMEDLYEIYIIFKLLQRKIEIEIHVYTK